jgi:hypothetical protein|tara:strand:+ start:66 stop:290 length:225 start_codon:yes stop_codon:yes gene_type:complete
MVAVKKPTEKQTFLCPDDKRELLEALNRAKEVCDDCLEGGSSYTHIVHDANDKMRTIARKLGYNQENWYCQFTL